MFIYRDLCAIKISAEPYVSYSYTCTLAIVYVNSSKTGNTLSMTLDPGSISILTDTPDMIGV